MNYRLDTPNAVEMIQRASGRSDAEVRALIAQYQELHWGIAPDRVLNVNDPLLPDCGGMGALVAVYLINGAGDYVALDFEPESWLGVEESKLGRLHLIATGMRGQVKRQYDRFIQSYPDAKSTLAQVAKAAPGRQNRFPWPRVDAMMLGVLTHILYHTNKRGDGPSTYIHEFGEETGLRPLLASDAGGRLWVAGGDYYTPPEGITN